MPATRFIPFTTLLVTLASTSACSTDESAAEPALRAAELSELALSPILLLDAGAMSGAGRFAAIAGACDAAPELSELDACGRTMLGSAVYAWSECSVELPDAAGADTLTSSGSFTLDSELEGTCGSDELSLARTLEFELARALEGGEMLIEGSATITRAAPTLDAAEVELDIARSIVGVDQAPASRVHGRLQVEVDRGTATRRASGTLTMSMSHPRYGSRSSEVELIDVVRGPEGACRWPIAGSVVHEGHTLEFSAVCGEATLDGEAVDLASVAAAHRGRGRAG